MKNKRKFQEYMAGCSEIFGKELTDTLNGTYWELLKPYSDQQCERAFKKIMTSSKFFPKPVELIDAMKENLELLNAPSAWGEVMGSLGSGCEPEDPLIRKTIQALGGWSWMSTLTYDELHWMEKRFYEHYSSLSETYEDQMLLEDSEERPGRLTENDRILLEDKKRMELRK